MSDLIKAIDDRTNLAGTNRLEVLMFRLEDTSKRETTELFGINVFKVRELIEVPELIKIPDSPDCLEGIANIRGTAVPVIDLKRYCGIESECAAKILVITEFNRSVQGFLVYDVDTIAQLAWSDIQEPPDVVTDPRANILTAISLLKDDRMLLIIDVEKVLADVLGNPLAELDDAEKPVGLDNRLVYFADDSGVARAQVAKILDYMGVPHMSAKNGQEALDMLKHLADEAELAEVALNTRLQVIVTDVEMPKMDGYVLTRNIKEDRRFDGIPVMMHSSLSSPENMRLGMKVGADAYMPKLRPKEFSEELIKLVTEAAEKKLQKAA